MPSTYSRRHAPCTTCGDVVLIATKSPNKILNQPLGKASTITLEHADPAPNGDVFDDVDDGCRRERVR